MTVADAKRIHDAFIDQLRAKHSWLLLPRWNNRTPAATEEPDAWLFWYTDPTKRGQQGESYEVVVVRKDDGRAFTLFGAVGRLYLNGGSAQLGLPTSSEQWLGLGPGRYQTFDKGYIVWDQLRDLGYLRVVGLEYQPVTVFGLVAFFDIRGFTGWSGKQPRPEAVQALLTELERLFNVAFCEWWCGSVFVKGTGDGLMVVSEASAFGGADPGAAARGHATAFLSACRRFLTLARPTLPAELALGCGIDCGLVQRVFLFGQRDYLGPQVNYAAKHQQFAWDEIVAAPRFLDELRQDGAEGAAIANNAKTLGTDKSRISRA